MSLSMQIPRSVCRESWSGKDFSETKAKKFLEDTDSRRASFHKYYTKQEWGLAQDYELCLDSGVLGIEGTVEVLTEYLRFRGFLGNE